MSYLNLPYKHCFEEICAAYPGWYMTIYEMVEVFRAEGELLDDVCDRFERIVLNNFFMTADDETLSQLEAALHIHYSKDVTLEQRRSVIIAHYIGMGHIGEPEIKQIVRAFTNRDCRVNFEKGIIYIHADAEITDTVVADDCFNILRTRIPAHLRIYTEFEVIFPQSLYVTSMAHQGDHYNVDMLPPVDQSAAMKLILGSAAVENARYGIDLRAQPGLKFSTRLFNASALAASAHLTAPLMVGNGGGATGRVYTGSGMAHTVSMKINVAPGPARREVAATLRQRIGTVEKIHYTILSRR